MALGGCFNKFLFVIVVPVREFQDIERSHEQNQFALLCALVYDSFHLLF